MVDVHTILHRHLLEIPSGVVDSTNTVFILSRTPDSTANIRLFINGLQQFVNVDFTVDPSDQRIITLDEAPLDTKGKIDDIKVEYTAGTRIT